MLTQDVRIGTEVNQFVWEKGIRNIPRRIRVRIQRKLGNTDGKETCFSEVRLLKVKSFKKLVTEKV